MNHETSQVADQSSANRHDPPIAFYETAKHYRQIGFDAAMILALDHEGDALRLHTLIATGATLRECCDMLEVGYREIGDLLDE